MTEKQKIEITEIAQKFASGFKDITIEGSGWLIVDPLSAYLNSCEFENELLELPANEKHPQVLIILFREGAAFIPAGNDLKGFYPNAKNWMWIELK